MFIGDGIKIGRGILWRKMTRNIAAHSEDILQGVLKLQSGEPPRRHTTLGGLFLEVGRAQVCFQRRQCPLLQRRVRTLFLLGRHLPLVHTVEDFYPLAKSFRIRKIMSEFFKVQWSISVFVMAIHAGRLNQRGDGFLES